MPKNKQRQDQPVIPSLRKGNPTASEIKDEARKLGLNAERRDIYEYHRNQQAKRERGER